MSTPFALQTLTEIDTDVLRPGTLTLRAVNVPPVGAAELTASRDAVGFGVREGQTLRVDDGGRVPDHINAGRGSRLRVEPGGSVGRNLEAVGAEITNDGGSIGSHFDAFPGSRVDLLSGSIGDGLTVLGGSRIDIYGGTIGKRFIASAQSNIEIFGREFFLNGKRINRLAALGDSQILNKRGSALLTGTLLDGSPFEFVLNYFSDAAVLRLTIGAAVPEPAAWTLAMLALFASGTGSVKCRRSR